MEAHRRRSAQWMYSLGLVLLAPLAGCAPDQRPPETPGEQDAAPASDGGGSGADGGGGTDFPAAPILEVGVPANAPDLFADPGTPGGGPCVIEPQLETLFPRMWIPLRVSFEPAGLQNLFELRFHAEHQVNDLRVYTTRDTWTMPHDLWTLLNQHFANQLVTVSVRGAQLVGGALVGAPAGGVAGSFRIAPVQASGSIVYWATGTGGGSSAFKGFKVGEEIVHELMVAAQASGATCVGCHSSTPDGTFVAFSALLDGTGDGSRAHVELRTLDGTVARPGFLTPAALELLAREYQQQPVFSQAHWSETERSMLSMFAIDGRTEIVWTDLLASSAARGVGWDVLTRTGDAHEPAAVAFSRGGTMVAYTSAPGGVGSGMNIGGSGDIYIVPFNDRAGGAATPLLGASTPGFTEHYAAFSADDQLVAFTRVANNQSAYDHVLAETFVVPSTGGEAVRLLANDPPACTQQISPGVTNSWPKWSPEVQAEGSTRYYWLTFSSKRGDGFTPQLYIAGVSVNEAGALTSYPAIYLWNQPADEANHTPAWDYFGIIID